MMTSRTRHKEDLDPKPATVGLSHGWVNTILSVLVALVVLLGSASGLIVHVLSLALILGLLAGFVSRAWGLYMRDLLWDLVRRPLAPELRWHRVQLAIRIAFLGGWLLVVSSMIGLLGVFGDDALLQFAGLVAVVSTLWIGLALVPRRQVRITGNVVLLLGLLASVTLWIWSLCPLPDAEITLEPPLCQRMAVLQGGADVLSNYHYATASQRDALDIVALDEQGRAISGEGDQLEDFVCFGVPVHAPISGSIIAAVRDLPDQEIGSMDLLNPVGNHVVIRTDDGRYVLLAHLRQDSLAVEAGDYVAVGDRLGECGNSGTTSMPHLHVQVQSGPDLLDGVETEVIGFVNVGAEAPMVLRRGDVVVASVDAACRAQSEPSGYEPTRIPLPEDPTSERTCPAVWSGRGLPRGDEDDALFAQLAEDSQSTVRP